MTRFLGFLSAAVLALLLAMPVITSAAGVEPLDLNTVSEEQPKTLPGIGDVYSKKIIAGRPYKRKDELVQKNIVPQATYDKIKDQVTAKQK